ncbi:protein enabled homolog [Austrofundulus limnaeus]|uniref:Protein enabled homolog n=1 Tax=Austrofundulus limnaeus TaxID=52670 RepID=A0A2I4B8Y0_AUSLI|nr:PREDICTED: protein enabled homolog [Austrofundulus limnaeus]
MRRRSCLSCSSSATDETEETLADPPPPPPPPPAADSPPPPPAADSPPLPQTFSPPTDSAFSRMREQRTPPDVHGYFETFIARKNLLQLPDLTAQTRVSPLPRGQEDKQSWTCPIFDHVSRPRSKPLTHLEHHGINNLVRNGTMFSSVLRCLDASGSLKCFCCHQF